MGKITDRTPLRPGGGKERIAPPPNPDQQRRTGSYNPGRFSPYAQTPGVDYPYMKPDSNLYPNEWNDVETVSSTPTSSAPTRITGKTAAASPTIPRGYGPIAFYVGGSGEAQFKDIAYKDLNIHYRAANYTSPNFTKQTINDFYYSWSAAAADFNRDGIMDIFSGPYIYYGPDYTKYTEVYLGQTVNPSTGYAVKGWLDYAADFTGDGWPDALSCKFIDADMGCYLYVNPKGQQRRWDVYRVLDKFDSEIALMAEIDGKGKPAIVYTGDGYVRYARARSRQSDRTCGWSTMFRSAAMAAPTDSAWATSMAMVCRTS